MYDHYADAKRSIPRYRPNGNAAPRRGGRRAGVGKKYEIADGAEKLIRARAYPVPLTEIADTLADEGIEISAKNPKGYISTVLYRDGRFQFIRGKGWVMNAKKEKGSAGETAEPELPELGRG